MPITANNLWRELLLRREELNLKYGFTIPFLVGTYYEYKFLTEEDLCSSKCISKLFEIIIETHGEDTLGLFMCEDNYNYILQFLKSGNRSEADIAEIQTNNASIDNVIYLNADRKSNTCEQKAEALYQKYGTSIQNLLFSFCDNEWKAFSDKEINFIKSLNY